jgi:hypothetical protein
MNLVKILPLFTLACSMSSFAASQKSFDESHLYGNWNCKHEIDDITTKMRVKIDYNVTVLRSGKSSGIGTLLFRLPNFPELEYRVVDNSTWQLTGNQLHLTSTDIKSMSMSHPEIDKIFNLKQLIPQKISESSTILALTKNRLDLKSDTYGGNYTCNKVVAKRT